MLNPLHHPQIPPHLSCDGQQPSPGRSEAARAFPTRAPSTQILFHHRKQRGWGIKVVVGKDSESYGIYSLVALWEKTQKPMGYTPSWLCPCRRVEARETLHCPLACGGHHPALWLVQTLQTNPCQQGTESASGHSPSPFTVGYRDTPAPHSHCLLYTLFSTGRAIGHRTYTHAGERFPLQS